MALKQQPAHVRKLQGSCSHWPERHHSPALQRVHDAVVEPHVAFV
jgi:hypothetical protein